MIDRFNIAIFKKYKIDRLFRYLSTLCNEKKSLGQLQRDQWVKLKILIQHAYDHVPYYNKLFKDAKITPADINNPHDMEKIPLSDKNSIRNAFPHDIISKGYTEADYIKDHTSGSCGIPLEYVVDKKALEMEGYMSLRVYRLAGVKWMDKFVHICPSAGNTYRRIKCKLKTKFARVIINLPLDFLEVSPWLNIKEQVNILEKYQPDIITAYGSSLFAIANKVRKTRTNLRPRICFSIAEFLPHENRKFIENILHTRVYRIYGSREFGEIGEECPKFRGYHLNIDCYFIEIVKGGKQCGVGEKGEIVITSLYNFAMPFIRYRIEDIGELSDESCSCGRTLPLLKEVIGRTSDIITAPSGEMVVPEFFWNPWREIKGLQQAQLVQEKKDLLILKMVVSKEFDKKALRKLGGIYKKKMGNITIKYEFVKEIPREKSGKYRMVKSKIPIKVA